MIDNIKRSAYAIYSTFFLLLFRIHPIQNNKIIFISYSGQGYGDNGKYIADELINYKNIIMYWATEKNTKKTIPKRINTVKYSSIKYFYHLATAKVWVNNSRFPLGTLKRKKQYYIQTWHGGIGVKKVEKDAENELPKMYIQRAKRDAKMTNLMVSGSTWLSNLYRKSFWYTNGEILESGLPRNDLLSQKNTHADIIKKVREFYKIKPNEKIFLYAPTFRNDGKVDHYNIDFKTIKEALDKKTRHKWKILVRLHPNISSKSKKLGLYNENILNATEYPDMQELYIASDMMMTDYSSCIFDYSILKRPAFLYAADYAAYSKERGGFYFDYFNLPFPMATNEDELVKNISNFDYTAYTKKLNLFLKKIGLNETGKSAKEIAKIIIEKTK